MEDAHRTEGPGRAPVARVLQLTDTHLFADPAGALKGVATEPALRAVVTEAARREPPPELVAVTGDLVHDGSLEGYERLAQALAPLAAPVRVVPGNHDDPARLCLAPGPLACCGEVTLGPWLLVFLDSAVPGEDWGRLGDAELGRLDAALAGHEGPAGVFVHHPPLPVGCAWLDAIGLRDGAALLELLAAHGGKARFVACGHVHQRSERVHAGVAVLTTPATCVQFRPHSERFALDPDAAPGYRRIELLPDGRFATEVVRVRAAAARAAAGGG